MRTLALALISFLLLSANAAAQQVRSALTTDTVRVGDIFGVAVQVDLPREAELIVPDTLALSGDLENAARKRVRVDSLADGTFRHLITYPITAWRPGQFPLPAIEIMVRTARGQQSLAATLPELEVLSVLPADTTGIEAKPPRDVWGASRLWWPLLLLAILALALLAAAIWWWRHRRNRTAAPAAEPLTPAIPPLEWALAELARIRGSGWLERGDYRRYYIALSETLRRYTAMLDGNWGIDLTTGELEARMRETRAEPGALLGILEHADLVKFAQHMPARDRAAQDLEAAQRWLENFQKPPLLAEAA